MQRNRAETPGPLLPLARLSAALVLAVILTAAGAQDADEETWDYTPALLRPFWEGEVVEGESVLFIRGEDSQSARASVLFPIRRILAVRNSAGDVTYEEGRDYVYKAGSREIVLPPGSRIVSRTPAELRRPAGTQKYALTHRDGNGEIFFGAKLEYAEMQTIITYEHEPGLWKGTVPEFDPNALPRSVHRLVNRQPLSIVVLGDSISAGANSSYFGDGPPYQPAYPELLPLHLHARFRLSVALKNLSVDGPV